jgi:hypothetical protein
VTVVTIIARLISETYWFQTELLPKRRMLSYQKWRRVRAADSEIPAVSVFRIGAYKYKPRGKIPLSITNNIG